MTPNEIVVDHKCGSSDGVLFFLIFLVFYFLFFPFFLPGLREGETTTFVKYGGS